MKQSKHCTHILKFIFILLPYLILGCRNNDSGNSELSGGCNQHDTFMQVKKSAPRGGVVFFADQNLTTSLGHVGPGIPVIRMLTLSVTPAGREVDDTMMEVARSVSASGAWVTTDKERTNNLGYSGPGTPVIRQLTSFTSTGVKVARVNIRGGSLANKVGWIAYSDLSPRETAGNTSASSTKVHVMQARILGGNLADSNPVGWTLASNLEPRDCPTGQASANRPQCRAHETYACDSAGCRCLATGAAPPDPYGNAAIETLSGLAGPVVGGARILISTARAVTVSSTGKALPSVFASGTIALVKYVAEQATLQNCRTVITSLSRNFISHAEKLKTSLPYLAKLEIEEIAAIHVYTHRYYRQINEALRTGNPAELARWEDVIMAASSGLNKLTDKVFQGTVYRAAKLSDDLIGQYEPGSTIVERGFTSTSVSTAVTATWKTNVQFVINSKNGKLIEDLSKDPFEKEVLFVPGTAFKVLTKETLPGKIYIHLDEVD